MRMLKMSIMKFSGMSKWKESHRESSELLTEAWRSPCGGDNQRHWSSPGWGGVLRGRREGWEPS